MLQQRQRRNLLRVVRGTLLVIGVTTKTNNKGRYLTDEHLYRSLFDTQRREYELLKRRFAETPPHLPAIMGSKEASEYLGVNQSTLTRWHDRGVLPAILLGKRKYKKYLLSHLWVFKMLWLEDENGC